MHNDSDDDSDGDRLDGSLTPATCNRLAETCTLGL